MLGNLMIFAFGSFTTLLKNSRSFSYFTLFPKKSLNVAKILADNEISLLSNLIFEDLVNADRIGRSEAVARAGASSVLV